MEIAHEIAFCLAVFIRGFHDLCNDSSFPDNYISTHYFLFQLSGSIALCQRGTCEFAMKAAVAQSGGAAGLLVLNTDEGYIILEAP